MWLRARETYFPLVSLQVSSSCLQKGSVLRVRKQDAREFQRRVDRVRNAVDGGESAVEFGWKSAAWLVAMKTAGVISFTKSCESGTFGS